MAVILKNMMNSTGLPVFLENRYGFNEALRVVVLPILK
jgi:hypothetical protein